MNLRSLLRGIAPAMTALAIVATGAASANASSLIVVTTSGEIGSTAATNFTNSACSLANCQGQTTAYNFAYTNLASAVAGAPGFWGNVAMDAATSTLSNYDGGAVLALDSDYNNGKVSTTLTDVAGDIVTINFGFAATQQALTSNCLQCQGPSNDTLIASVDGTVRGTEGPLSISSQAATGFTNYSISFVGTGSDVLSFLATSTTSNVPAFALVDNVTLSQVPPPAPEPNSLILLGTGLAGLGGFVRSRFVKASAKA